MMDRIENNFSFIIVLAFILGLLFPKEADLINPYMIYVLIGIMYFTMAKMDMLNTRDLLISPTYMFAIIIVILFITPLLFYYLSLVFYPEIAASALIIGALPAALASSSITDILKGDVKISLVVTVITSLIAPFSIPLLIRIFIGVETDANVSDMLIMLSEVIFVPFVLAIVTKKYFPKFVSKTKMYYSSINIFLLFLTVFGPIGHNSSYIKDNLDIAISISLFFFFLAIILHVIGWYISYKRPLEQKISSTVVVFYNNITLGIVFASNFFSPLITLSVVLYNIPWCVMLVPLQYALRKRIHYNLHSK